MIELIMMFGMAAGFWFVVGLIADNLPTPKLKRRK